MRSAVALSLFALEASATIPGVIPMSYEKRRNPYAPRGISRRSNLSKRAGTISVPLGNAEVLYYANVTVGTPGQFLEMQLDTGSSDVWMTDSSAAYCEESEYACQGGTFDPSSSSTYNALSTVFNITYVDGSESVGKYFTDDFTIGGVSLTKLEMGLATTTTIGTGIIGVCFAADEAVCDTDEACNEYPTIVEDMVTQGKINSQAYSLWLDDLEALTGSILFGGIDLDKYTGSLITLPILKDAYSGGYTSFSVSWTSLSYGSTTYTTSDYDMPAILDSGTTLTLLPTKIFNIIAAALDVQYDQQAEAYLVPCSKGTGSATFDFQFGGSSGPTIKVPISEFFIPLADEYGDATSSTGEATCEFGIEPAGKDPVLFGDTFLRSAYVVYDLANKEISMAQTNFNSTTSNIQAIAAGANGVPDVSGSATSATISQTASAVSSYGVTSVSATTKLMTTYIGTRSVTASTMGSTTAATSAAAFPIAVTSAASSMNVATSTVESTSTVTSVISSANTTTSTTEVAGVATSTTEVSGEATSAVESASAAVTSVTGGAVGLSAPSSSIAGVWGMGLASMVALFGSCLVFL